jgi:hypothetical protein
MILSLRALCVATRALRRTVAALGLIAAAIARAAPVGGGDRPAKEGAGALPPDGFLEAWRREPAPRVFEGADLYGHINGGAEVFLELGFDRLDVVRYDSDGGAVEVERYRMTDPTAALGVYLMKCGSEHPDPALAARNTASPLQLQMVRGSDYVIVSSLRPEEDLGQSLVAFARSIAEQIPEERGQDPFAILPTAGRVAVSERVVRGPFTLEPLYTLGEGDVLQLRGERTAVAAEYEGADGQRSTRIVAAYGDAAAAGRAFAHLVSNLDPYLEVLSSGNDRLVFKDYRERFGVVELDEQWIKLHVDLVSRPEGSIRAY